MTRYTVPAYDQDPSEEFIDWLHENVHPWHGDSVGICFENPEDEGGDVYAYPGDTVYRDERGFYRVEQIFGSVTPC